MPEPLTGQLEDLEFKPEEDDRLLVSAMANRTEVIERELELFELKVRHASHQGDDPKPEES